MSDKEGFKFLDLDDEDTVALTREMLDRAIGVFVSSGEHIPDELKEEDDAERREDVNSL